MTRESHHAARSAFHEGISAADRRSHIDTALAAAAAAGVGLVHENAGPHVSSEDDVRDVIAAGERGDGPQVDRLLGRARRRARPEARELLQRLGVHGLAGDLNIDGSFGSRTAALRAPYADADHHGNAYLSVEQVRDHVVACTLAGAQAGFHVIGDAGADTVIEGMQAAADVVGAGPVPAGPAPARAPRDGRRRGHRHPGAASAWWPACSRRSTPSGAAPTACTPRAWAPSAP